MNSCTENARELSTQFAARLTDLLGRPWCGVERRAVESLLSPSRDNLFQSLIEQLIEVHCAGYPERLRLVEEMLIKIIAVIELDSSHSYGHVSVRHLNDQYPLGRLEDFLSHKRTQYGIITIPAFHLSDCFTCGGVVRPIDLMSKGVLDSGSFRFQRLPAQRIPYAPLYLSQHEREIDWPIISEGLFGWDAGRSAIDQQSENKAGDIFVHRLWSPSGGLCLASDVKRPVGKRISVGRGCDSSGGISISKVAALYRGAHSFPIIWLNGLSDVDLVEPEHSGRMVPAEGGHVSPSKVVDAFYGSSCGRLDRPFTPDEIEGLAVSLRECLSVGDVVFLDLLSVVDELAYIFDGFALNIVEATREETLARSDSRPNTVTIREDLYESLKQRNACARMALAHELGHIVLSHQNSRPARLDKLGQEYFGSQKEQEAAYFARAFLVPHHLLSGPLSAQEIGERFGVTRQAADDRLLDVQQYRQSENVPS